MVQGENENYTWQKLPVEVSKNGENLGTLEPERRLYKASQAADVGSGDPAGG